MRVDKNSKKMAAKVLRYIETYPWMHNQSAFAAVADEDGEDLDLDEAVVSTDPNVCNTTMCIAGTVRYFTHGVKGLKDFDASNDEMAVHEAGEALGLEYEEYEALFYTFDNQKALNLLRAVRDGDEDKFWDIKLTTF